MNRRSSSAGSISTARAVKVLLVSGVQLSGQQVHESPGYLYLLDVQGGCLANEYFWNRYYEKYRNEKIINLPHDVTDNLQKAAKQGGIPQGPDDIYDGGRSASMSSCR